MARKGGNIFQRILQLVLDTKSVEKTRRETQDALDKATDPKAAEKNVNKLEAAFKKWRIAALAVATALVGGVVLALRKITQESSAAQKVMAQQEAVLRSTGMAAGRTVEQLNKQAQALSRLTTFQDDAITSTQNLLLTFRKIREEEFDKAVEVTLDFATAMGVDASSAAVQLGKALNDPINGLNSLRRVGVSFSESQREVIKNLVETNRLAEAQQIILQELQVEFGGSAEAARSTLGGALEGLTNAWNDLFEVSREDTDGIVRAINAISGALGGMAGIAEGALQALFDLFDQAKLGIEVFNPEGTGPFDLAPRRATSFGELRLLEDPARDKAAADARAAEREHLRQLEEEKEAQAAIAEAEKERREAEAKAHDARIREQEELFGWLVAARDAGFATAEEERQLQVLHQAIFATIQDGNVALEQRVRLSRLLQGINKDLLRDVGERKPPEFNPFGGGPIRAPGVTAQEAPFTGADAFKNAWVEAFQTVGFEAQVASGLIEAAFSSDGFLRGLARVASAKAKENIARAIETAAGGLAAFVFGDPTKLAPAAKASAGFLAAAAAWGAIGAAGGGAGGGGVGGGGGFSPSAPAGRSVDRLPTQQMIHITQYIDGIDPKLGEHQEKVGDAILYYSQRKGRGR